MSITLIHTILNNKTEAGLLPFYRATGSISPSRADNGMGAFVASKFAPDVSILIPDDLFDPHYPSDGCRFPASEVDLRTERIRGSNVERSSFAAKIAVYQDVLACGQIRTWWGIPNLTVLTVTTNQRHAANLFDHVYRAARMGECSAFAAEPSFGTNWRVPMALLDHLLTDPWATIAEGKCFDRP